jgi:hypothetical protein
VAVRALEPAPAPALELSAGATYRGLLRAGLSAREAATLTGRLHGLPAVYGGWTIAEIERLLFVGELVRLGRLGS